jgi:hypothetical protein
MKKKVIILQVILITALLACNKQKIDNQMHPTNNGISIQKEIASKTTKTPVSVQKNHNIVGLWKIEGDDNPIFEISKDSIFYIDQGETFQYSISRDSIIIYYSDWIYKGLLKVQQDKNVITISDGNNINKYVRVYE